MLFDHGIVAKRNFYEGSANIPLILTGKPIEEYCEQVDSRLVCLADVMPTLLSLCDISKPDSVEGVSVFSSEKRDYLYGEVGELDNATKMIHNGRYKLIYYATGNYLQLFDLHNDPKENRNLAGLSDYSEIINKLVEQLIQNLYGSDEELVIESRLIGREHREFTPKPDHDLYNQRGSHWPPPSKYKNVGFNL